MSSKVFSEGMRGLLCSHGYLNLGPPKFWRS